MSHTFLSACVHKAAMRHAEACTPEESCGLVVAGHYLPCDNLAKDKPLHFLIDAKKVLTWLKAKTLEAVIHSHPYPHPAAPSLIDMQSQLAMAVPWGIVPVDQGKEAGEAFFWGEGVPVLPLLGRPYRHGVTDGYSVVRDWYRLERDIKLPDYARDFGWWQANDHPNPYEQHFQEAGFVEIPFAEACTGDGFLIALGRRGVVSHAGVLAQPGLMLHHPASEAPFDPACLSRLDPVVRWQPHIRRTLRYVGQRK